MRFHCFQVLFCIIGSTNDQSIVYTRCLRVSKVELMGYFELDTSQNVVSNLKVVELNNTNPFSNSSISSVFPTCEVVEIGSEGPVSMIRISLIGEVSNDWLAREFSWNHVMEDS